MALSFEEAAAKKARLFKHFVLIRKFNPYHGKDGRFTNAGGAASFTWKPGASAAHDKAIEREKKRIAEAEEKNKPKGVYACTSVEQVQQMMSDNGWFDESNTNGVNLSGVDLKAAQEIYTAYEQVFERYPDLQGWFKPVQAEALGSNTYANCRLVGGKVTVNKSYYSDTEKLSQRYAEDVKSGWHPANTDWRGIVTHEIGHAVDGLLSMKGVNGASLFDTWQKKANPISKQMKSSVNKAAKTKIKETEANVSRYATKNHLEWFAECFAEFMTSPSPRPVAKEFGKQLDQIIGGIDINEW